MNEKKNQRDPLEWEEVRTEHIVQDEWIDFRRSAYRFPDGTVFEPYYSYSRRDYVVIVATDAEGNYLNFRPAALSERTARNTEPQVMRRQRMPSKPLNVSFWKKRDTLLMNGGFFLKFHPMRRLPIIMPICLKRKTAV